MDEQFHSEHQKAHLLLIHSAGGGGGGEGGGGKVWDRSKLNLIHSAGGGGGGELEALGPLEPGLSPASAGAL